MPCGMVHPKQRGMADDVPRVSGLRYPVAAAPAGPAYRPDPILEYAATIARQRHAVKLKILGFFSLGKSLQTEGLAPRK
jgi:hypothetical protein